MDPADAYVQLYDILKSNNGSDLDDWSQEPQVDDIIRQVCTDVLADADGELPDSWMHAGPLGVRGLLGVLLGLDRALLGANQETDDLDDRSLAYLRDRLRIFGRLNDNASGTLLFRHACPGRPIVAPQTLDDLLHLVRIPPDSGIHVEPLSEAEDLPDLGLERSEGAPTALPLEIAQLPLLADADDLRWQPVDRPQRSYYLVHPDGPRLSGQPSAALTTLDDSGAIIALLPEASLDDDLLVEWQEALRNVVRPDHSQLTWLLIGTGPVTKVGGASGGTRPPNRAVLLNRKGDLLLTQDKQRGFPLTAEKQDDYGLRIGAPPPVARAEYHAQGAGLSLLESRYGRFGVHICEDIGWHHMRGDVITAGATHLFVPVLAAPVQEQGWQESAAMELVKEAGTGVAVTNGLAIARYARDGSPATTLLVIEVPPEHTEDRYLTRGEMVRVHSSPLGPGATAREDAMAPRRGSMHPA